MPKPTPSKRSALPMLRLLALPLILMPMAACVTLGSGLTRYVDTACTAFQPITYSSHDTAETITEIRAHNRVYDKLCPAPAH